MYSLDRRFVVCWSRAILVAGMAAICAYILFGAPTAHADERGPHRIRIELDGAYSLRANDERDGLGFGGAAEYEYIFAGIVGLGLRYEGVAFPYDTEMWEGSGFGVYHGIGPEVRLHLARNARRVDPWLSGGPRIALTGDLVRLGLSASFGVDFLLGRAISLGPTVRYGQIIQPDDDQAGGADGRVLTFGLGLAWGPPAAREGDGDEDPADDAEAPADEADPHATQRAARDDGAEDVPPLGEDGRERARDAEREVRTPEEAVDTDGDGVFDDEDACPNEPAPGGCPPPPPIDLRVSDFDFDSAFLNEEQVRQLRLVLDRLRSDRRIRRVEVVGHADQIGAEAHNVRLSERRAASVVEWLVSHGIARRRLVAVGRGSAQPLVQGGSPEQLGTNRRVEFIIVDPPPASN